MLTFLEMKNQVAHRINKTSAEYLTKIGEWINYRYDDIVSRHDWPQLYKSSTITVSAGDSTIVLPRDVKYIISLEDRTNDINLTPFGPSAGSRGYVDVINSNGVSSKYWWEGVSVLAQPSTAAVVSIVSSSASDTTQYVRIWGTDSNGAEISESVLLTGTSAASTTASFLTITNVSKDGNTVGLITGTSGSTTVFKIDPYSFGSSHTVIRLLPPSDSDLTFNIAYKRIVPRLINNEDTPIIDCSHALIIGGYIDALRQQRQHQKAKMLEYNPTEPYDPTTYEGRVRSMIQEVDQQTENVPLLVPRVSRLSIDRIGA